MKTNLLFTVGATVVMFRVATEAQTPKPADAKPAPAPQIEIESKFFTISASAAERLKLMHSPGNSGAAWRSGLSKADFEKLVRVLNGEKSVNILSSPRVTTKSGQRAVIEVIREFRYPTGFEQRADGLLAPKAFETRNTGIALEVEPVLSDGELIDLKVKPSLTAFQGFVGYAGGKTEKPDPIPKNGFTQPIFDMMEYAVSATLRSEQTLLLGGFPWTGSNQVLENPLQNQVEAKPEADPKVEPRLMFVTLTARLVPRRVDNEIMEAGPVKISAHLVNVSRDRLPATVFPMNTEGSSQAWMTLEGIFDPKQAEAMRKALEEESGSALSSGPTKAIAPDGRYSVEATGLLRYAGKKDTNTAKSELETERMDLDLEVEAHAGPESVIDLDIIAGLTTSARPGGDTQPEAGLGTSSAEWKWRQDAPHRSGRVITTAVSVYSGNTVMLARASEGRPDHIQILLITATGTRNKESATAPELRKQTAPAPAGGGNPQKWPSAIPVPGKPGFVMSPYAPEKGFVDVRGFPPGTEVQCPYTRSIFIVP